MDCDRIDALLDANLVSRGGKFSDEARRHLNACPRCRDLYDWFAAGPASTGLSPALCDRITDSLTSSLQPARRIPPLRVTVFSMLVMCALWVAALLSVTGAAGVARMTPLQLSGVSVLLAAGVFLLSLSLSWQMRPGSRQRFGAGRAMGVCGAGVLAGVALLFPWQTQPGFVMVGWPCLAAGLGMAAPAALLLWLVVRRGAPLSAGAMGATLGATAGLLGLTVLQYRCPHQDALHLLVWHGGVVAAAAIAGLAVAWLAQRFFSRA